MKKIKTAEEYNKEFWNEMSDDTTIVDVIKQAQLDMLEYAVNKCLSNAYAIGKGTNLTTKSGNLYWTFAGNIGDVVMDEQSILKTIDEIKEELYENKKS